MLQRVSFVAVLILSLAATGLAEKKRIKLKSGRVFVGDVVEKTAKGIKVKGKLAVVFYAADQIESIEDVRKPASDFAGRWAKIDKTNAAAHIGLGRWAMARKLYKQAVQCFEGALKIEKSNERAKLLLRMAKARLEDSAQNNTGDKPSGDGNDGTAGRTPFDNKLLLKTEDIYRIRLEELRKDDRVSIRFRNDVIERFIRGMQGVGDFRTKGFDTQFRKASPLQQAKYILVKADRDDRLKDDILVRTDPAFMREFRTAIWPVVAKSCASVTCHGAPKGKSKLRLLNFVGRNTQVEYTNFLILDSFQTKGLSMIRRDDWERSLLLQYALPSAQAEFHHPKKKRAMFPSRESSGYRQVLTWIKKLSGPRHPNYRVKYRPPNVMAPTSVLPGLPVRTPATPKKTKPNQPKKTNVPF